MFNISSPDLIGLTVAKTVRSFITLEASKQGTFNIKYQYVFLIALFLSHPFVKLQRGFFWGGGEVLREGFIAHFGKKEKLPPDYFILNDSHTQVHIPLLISPTKSHKILGGRKNTDVAFNACRAEAK